MQRQCIEMNDFLLADEFIEDTPVAFQEASINDYAFPASLTQRAIFECGTRKVSA